MHSGALTGRGLGRVAAEEGVLRGVSAAQAGALAAITHLVEHEAVGATLEGRVRGCEKA